MEESNILSVRNMSRLFLAFSFDCLMVLNIPRTNPAMPHIPTIMLTMINMLSISTSCNQAALDCYRKGDFDNNITIDNLQSRMAENALFCHRAWDLCGSGNPLLYHVVGKRAGKNAFTMI
jgi:hypothetical protein